MASEGVIVTVSVIMEKKLAAACLAVILASVGIMCVWRMVPLLLSISWRQQRQGEKIVITIEDSPCPTKTMSTPRKSPWPAQRRGGRRRRHHKRASTKAYDPDKEGECGYQCLLKIAGKSTKDESIAWLRRMIADKVHEARMVNRKIAGIEVHDYIAERGLTLKAYEAEVRGGLWASALELQLGAEVLGITAGLRMGGKYILIGEKRNPIYDIVMRGKHFILMTKHGKKRYSVEPSFHRAGMRNPWTDWQRERPQELEEDEEVPEWARVGHARAEAQPQHEMEENATYPWPTPTALPRTLKVEILIPEADVHSLLMDRRVLHTVAKIKVRVGAILQRVPSTLEVTAIPMGAPLEDTMNAPEIAYVRDKHLRTYNYARLAIRVPDRNTQFIIHIAPEATSYNVHMHVAAVLGVMPEFVELKTMDGGIWQPAGTTADQAAIATVIGMRGGAGGTVSTTEPCETQRETAEQEEAEEGGQTDGQVVQYEALEDTNYAHGDGLRNNENYNEEDERNYYEDPEIEQTWRRDAWEAARAPIGRRAPSSSRSRSPASSIRRMSASPTRHNWYSEALPDDIPSAQLEPVCRVAVSGEYPIGYIYASPEALVANVMETMRSELHITVDMLHEPRHVRHWRDVERIELGDMEGEIRPFTYDLRVNRWEMFQRTRVVPILHDARVEAHVVIPWFLPMQIAQQRLNSWSPVTSMHILMAANWENWYILRTELPASVITAMEMAQIHFRRGGGKQENDINEEDEKEIDWDDNATDKKIYEHDVVWAAPEHCWGVWEAHSIPKGATAAELRKSLAVFYMHNVEGVEMYTSMGKVEDTDYVESVCFFPVHVSLKRHGKEGGGLGENVNTGKQAEMKVQKPKYVEIESGWDSDGQEEMVMDPKPLRAGGKNKGYIGDPKVAMHAWAMQKSTEQLPHANAATLSMLFKAEARTVSAVMHAKSTTQLTEVINAALRRAGLPPLSDTQQQASSSSADYLIASLDTQTRMTSQLLQASASQPTAENYMQMVEAFKLQTEAQTKAVESLAMVVGRLERRIEEWETSYLREIVDRLPHGVPPSAASEESEPAQDIEEGVLNLGDLQPLHPQPPPQSEIQQEVTQPVNALEIMREKSLTNQASKVARKAMRPFGRN